MADGRFARFFALVGLTVGLTGVGFGAVIACGARTSLDVPAVGQGGGLPGTTAVGAGPVTGGVATSSSNSATLSASSSTHAVSSTGVATTSSTGVLVEIGCADGTREGFRPPLTYPLIAACNGAFDEPGLACAGPPTCGRQAGNDGPVPGGQGCSAEDLCAPGWHVCLSGGEVAVKSPNGCTGANDAPPGSFYATRQSGPGYFHCATCGGNACQPACANDPNVTTNDLFGCGNVGAAPDPATCGVLDRTSNNLCGDLPPSWQCGSDGYTELLHARHVGASGGGVLCCKD